jgi:RHS repeat-associated protein
MSATRRCLLWCVCCVATVLSLGQAGGSALARGALAGNTSATRDAAQAGSLVGGPLIVPDLQLLDQGQQLHDSEQARRWDPNAVTRRAASQSAYSGALPEEEAAKVDAEAFPEVINDLAGGPPQLPSGQRISGYSAPGVAQLDLGEGNRGVLESTAPMAIETSPGQLVPIDLSLTEVGVPVLGTEFQPTRPQVGVQIPKKLAEGAKLSRSGVSLTPVDSSGAPLSGSQGKVDHAVVFYANTQTDADAAIKPNTYGFSTDTFLRSSSSPEQLFFKIGLPPGASLVPAADGSGAVDVVAEGATIVSVFPSSAHDAAGTVVPVSSSLSGNVLTLTVPRASGTYQYPIDVDPTATETSKCGGGGVWQPYAPFAGWSTSTGGCESQIQGLAVSAQTYAYYQNHTKGKSEIYALSATTSGWDNFGAGHARVTQYIQSGGHLQAAGEIPTSEPSEYSLTVCVQSGCPPVVDAYTANTAYWQVSAAANEESFKYHFSTAQVSIAQNAVPRTEADTADEYVRIGNASWQNALYTGAPGGQRWVNGNAAIAFNGFDEGLGVYRWKLHTYPTDETSWSGRLDGAPNERGQCTGVQCPEAWTFWTTVANLPDGIDEVQASTENATGSAGTAVVKVKVDKTPPAISLSGLLSEADGKVVTLGKLGLNATLQDGSGSTPSSGVREGYITVDGLFVTRVGNEKGEGGCTPGPCSRELSYTFTPSEFSQGQHVIKVVGIDVVGQRAERIIALNVGTAASAPVGPGTVNLTTGAYTLKAQDVSVAAPGAALTVSRTSTSGAESASAGPLGGQWQLDLPQSKFQSLEQEPGGYTVVARERGGHEVSFYSAGGGNYIAPAGAATLFLTVSGANATLTDSSGEVTTFAENRPGHYDLSSFRLPGAPAATKYTFQTVGESEAIEPTQVLAPEQAGVSCSTLQRGCRALQFVYAAHTTAKGNGPSQWGSKRGRLEEVNFTAWDPAKEEITTTPVAQYVYDFVGRLRGEWDPRISPTLETTYEYGSESAGPITEVTPPGLKPFQFTYAGGRLVSVSRPVTAETSQTWSVQYNVPVSGSGSAYPMGAKDVESWGQTDLPVGATAIFPPDEVPAGNPPADYRRATVYYLDTAGMLVNTAEPGGRISTSEYDQHNLRTLRALTSANRVRALEAGSGSAAQSRLLDTEMTYNQAGTELISQLGPQHPVKRASGAQVEARPRVQYTYEEHQAPNGAPYNLMTQVTSGAQISGQPEADVRTTTYSYSGQENLGLTLRKPTSITTDPGGLNLVHTTLYDPATGHVQETRQPAEPEGVSAHSTQSIYYTAGSNSSLASCGNHPEWAGLLCVRRPGKQPSGTLPKITTLTESSYNVWDEALSSTEAYGATSRTSTVTYDAAGRVKTQDTEGTAGSGTSLPPVSFEYDERTGTLTAQSSGEGAGLKTIASAYNTLGQLTSFTDADANKSTYKYDIDGRLIHTNDGKGTQSYAYDATTGDLTSIEDSQAGKFTASYDANGRLIGEGYPNGMSASYSFNSAGEATTLTYVKTSNCAINCTWYSDEITPSIHGQWLSQVSTLSSQSYSYDSAGRLTQVKDTPAGVGQACTARVYAYDKDSNRLKLTTRPPTIGKCAATGGTVQKHTYDTADRLKDEGVAYDAFGNITALPSGEAGESAVTSTYYQDNTLATQSQEGATIEYLLDPAGNPRETISTGSSESRVVSHYAEPTDAPAWTVDSQGHWTRYIPAFSGLSAIDTSSGKPVLQLTNLHGDVVATAAVSETEVKPLSTADPTEFGVPRSAPSKYSWLGAAQRATELPSGIVSMGARTYVPQLGRFEQTDRIEGSSANAYDYSAQDPVGNTDLGGEQYETPYTPVLDMSGNEIAEGYAAQAVVIYEELLARQLAESLAYEQARLASEAQRQEAEMAELEDKWAYAIDLGAGSSKAAAACWGPTCLANKLASIGKKVIHAVNSFVESHFSLSGQIRTYSRVSWLNSPRIAGEASLCLSSFLFGPGSAALTCGGVVVGHLH